MLPAFADSNIEAVEVAKDIKALHSDHFSSVVVLGRSRRLLEVIEKSLKNEGVDAIITQRKNEFESTPFIWLHSILRLANDRQNNNYLEAVCGTFTQLTQLKIDPEDIIEQSQGSNLGFLQHWTRFVNQKSSDTFIMEVTNHVLLYLIEGRDFRSFSNFALKWFDELLQKYVQTGHEPESEIFFHFEEEKSVWKDLLHEIIESLGDEITLEAFLQELQIYSKEPTPKPNTVVLMTIHSAKGKEFDHVYIVGLVDDELPSFQSKQKGDNSPEMEEERRNCFVAITRTIKTLTLSYSSSYRGWQKKPSRFLYEMKLL